jgi:DNA (cytosine-5)-methyltransferase 1
MKFLKGELFSGPGGLALGAQEASTTSNTGELFHLEHAWSNDFSREACDTYIRNLCPSKPESVYCKPVQELEIDTLPPIDALFFGFPCNDYSIVGEHKGMDGDYGPLYSYGVKVLEKHNPKFFVAENVGGLQSANEGNTFLKILESLATAGNYGYRITPHLYKFEEYGVPQARHRIIIVGIRNDLGLQFEVPSTITKNKYIATKEAIESPPIPEDAPNHEFTRHNKRTIEMLNYIGPGENAWSEKIPEHLRLKVKAAKLSQIYRRLRSDRPAYTITGSGGGGTHAYHWEEPRALTNRERARLQTFPDHFIFEGGKEKVRQQIGMAVPPKAAKIIVEAILKTFAKVSYDSVPAKWNYSQMSIQAKLPLTM